MNRDGALMNILQWRAGAARGRRGRQAAVTGPRVRGEGEGERGAGGAARRRPVQAAPRAAIKGRNDTCTDVNSLSSVEHTPHSTVQSQSPSLGASLGARLGAGWTMGQHKIFSITQTILTHFSHYFTKRVEILS